MQNLDHVLVTGEKQKHYQRIVFENIFGTKEVVFSYDDKKAIIREPGLDDKYTIPVLLYNNKQTSLLVRKKLEAGKYTINVEESDCSQIVFYFDDLQPNNLNL